MSTITINHAFTMGQQEVLTQLQGLADKMADRYELQCAWPSTNRLTFKRSGADGEINVAENSLSISLKLGMMLSFFKQAIEEDICKFLKDNIH